MGIRRASTRVFSTALLLALLTGCTARYRVRPAHLDRAVADESAAIPALDEGDQGRYIRISATEDIGEVDPRTRLIDVDVTDPSRLVLAGWGAAAAGAALTLLGVWAVVSTFDDCKDACDVGDAVLLTFGVGVPTLILGGALLGAGYAADEPEVPGPSPGMPETVGSP